MIENDQFKLKEKYKKALGLMIQLDVAIEHMLNKHGFPIEDEYVKSISDYLVFKSKRTLNSIRLLSFAGCFDDAYCLYRVLIENIVNFIYLSKYPDEIEGKYYSSESKSLKKPTEMVFHETKGLTDFKAPYRSFNADMIEGMKFVAKEKKESQKKHKNDKWSPLTIEYRILKIGLDPSLYLPYLKGSSLIHSSWFDRKGFLNHELHDDYISDLFSGASYIYFRMIVQLNDNLINPDPRIEDRCSQILIEIQLLLSQDN